jgi:hypothetical protein
MNATPRSQRKRWTRRGALRVGALGVLGFAGYVVAKQSSPSGAIGVDVSWPQANIEPSSAAPAFVIVGVTGGTASTINPYLVDQLTWASRAGGALGQPPVQLYTNTANPGQIIDQVTTWPTGDTDQMGHTPANPYGACDGTNSLACSWQYGWTRSVDVVNNMFAPAAMAAGIDADPATYRWWLDVETGNTWQAGSDEALARNTAALEGMVSCFHSRGARVGLYSTAAQWAQIVGATVAETSVLTGLDSWIGGVDALAEAKKACREGALTARGRVALAQYLENDLDHDYVCPR